ncbi:DgyrCDS11478 [Dimorphilus gyrociliatus]|uniref:Mediator of RNA polymerase II transcription subunit 29 n=1 Tax=Dimorphilus gyrociliatus TaxID=2664684 RepID=A0A7I8W807_9ANNE|nr:DgyrCDS11478 [Dimorphilus gyrociliatus]
MSANSSQNQEIDPIHFFKSTLPELKTSISNLFTQIADFIEGHKKAEDCKQPADQAASQALSKEIGNAYGLLDQLEYNLKLAAEVCQEATDSQRHAPFNLNELVDVQKSQQSLQSVSLNNYTTITQTHIQSIQIIRDLLVEFSKAISKNSTFPASSLSHTQPLQHQNIALQMSRASTLP